MHTSRSHSSLRAPLFRATRAGLALAAACLAAGTAACGPAAAPALGSHDVDAHKLADRPNLAHLSAALPSGSAGTIHDLFELQDNLVFDRAPDPTDMLVSAAASDDARKGTVREELRVLSFNAGLLDTTVFGFIPYKKTPLIDERREALPAMLIEYGHDILMLQEVWTDRDATFFIDAFEAAGYKAVTSGRAGYNDGILVAIKADLIDGDLSTTGVEYEKQDGLEYFPGPAIRRGFQSVAFRHKTLGDVVVFNTHMQAFSTAWKERMAQARQLGIAVRDAAKDADVVLVGGDMNAGPYYKNREWTLPDGKVETVWWQNTVSYPLLLEYGGLSDLVVMGRAAEDAASDVTLGQTVKNDASKSTEVPGVDPAWCRDTPHIAFTASDCNTLYFQQYGGTEYPARLDHVLGRFADDRVRVSHAAVTFTESLTFGSAQTEPSDHYGVEVTLEFLEN